MKANLFVNVKKIAQIDLSNTVDSAVPMDKYNTISVVWDGVYKLRVEDYNMFGHENVFEYYFNRNGKYYFRNLFGKIITELDKHIKIPYGTLLEINIENYDSKNIHRKRSN